MSVTYGFYNSINGDRKYDAIQMSSIFDGIIKDGVFMSIGDHLTVREGQGMTVIVGPGRAWFNHTWTLNSSDLPIVLDDPDIMHDRIDTIILEINSNDDVRANNITKLTGDPSVSPVPKDLINNEKIHQYPLAYITVKAESERSEIKDEDITNKVGTSDCPFITGILETINIDSLIRQWSSEWENWKQNNTEEFEVWSAIKKNEFQIWFNSIQDDYYEINTVLNNIVFSPSMFEYSGIYQDYPYSANINNQELFINNVVATVIFSLEDSISDIFAPICNIENNSLYIYSSEVPKSNVTIPTILLTKTKGSTI